MKQPHCVEIIETRSHPESSKLTICIVSDGFQHTQVITSAKNVRNGLRTILAPVGTILENGLEIMCNGLKGIFSDGMLCTENDLGVSEEKNLVDLGHEIKLGQELDKIDKDKLSNIKWDQFQEVEVFWLNLLTDEIYVEHKGQLGCNTPLDQDHWIITAKTYFFEGKYIYREFKID